MLCVFNYILFGMKTEEGQRPFCSCGRATVTTCRCRWGALLDAPAAVGERCSTPVVSVDGQRLLALDSFVLVEAPRLVRSLCSVIHRHGMLPFVTCTKKPASGGA